MAVRFDAAADRLLITSSLPNPNNNYTWAFWVYLSVDMNAFSKMACFSPNSNTLNEEDMGTDSNGTTLRLRCNDGGTATIATGTNLSVATWYHVAMVRESATSLKAYLNAVLDITNTKDVSGRSTSPTRMEMGAITTSNSTPMSGRVFAIKFWTTNLSAADIANEMRTIRPIKTDNLWAWWPTLPGTTERLRDYSGNGHGWTESGTLTDEDHAPVSWGGKSFFFITAPSGTLYTQSVSGGITPAGLLVLKPGKVLTGGLSPAGTIAQRTNKPLTGAVSTITGTLANQPRKSFTGSISSIVGTLVNRPGKVLTGAVSSITGALLNRTSKAFTGSASSIVGTLTKQPRKVLSGGITPSGTLSAIKTVLLSLTGSISSISGSLIIRTNKALTGAISSIVGTLVKQPRKVLTGSITPSGVESGIKTSLLTLTGSVSSIVGTLVKRPGKLLTGGITPMGAETNKPAKAFSGAVSSITGGLVKRTNKVLSGGITPTGTERGIVTKVLTGTVASAGSLTRQARKLLSGIVSAAGDLLAVLVGSPIGTGIPPTLRPPVVLDLFVKQVIADLTILPSVLQALLKTSLNWFEKPIEASFVMQPATLNALPDTTLDLFEVAVILDFTLAPVFSEYDL